MIVVDATQDPGEKIWEHDIECPHCGKPGQTAGFRDEHGFLRVEYPACCDGLDEEIRGLAGVEKN